MHKPADQRTGFVRGGGVHGNLAGGYDMVIRSLVFRSRTDRRPVRARRAQDAPTGPCLGKQALGGGSQLTFIRMNAIWIHPGGVAALWI